MTRCRVGAPGTPRRRAGRGFSLPELLAALAIVAVLMLVALPAYRQHVLEARRLLARLELQGLQLRQEQFFLQHRRYARDLLELGLPASPYALDGNGNPLPASAPQGLYLIALDAEDAAYRLRAIPRSAQAADRHCGTLGLASSGSRSASGAGPLSECW